ncbi:uncharacterized protein LOC117649921 [Thrips palmi]|uniref:Uncharacterized protein LOC117649921 n=1 Tax=Thrips palmi TaxID=161013 RepID=A0A6P8ZUM0_THRPL|nr:uncharacterized protein LOC117649921 [Thrips palmi]
MGRSKKKRPAKYKSYYDRDLAHECDVPESTQRYRNRQQNDTAGENAPLNADLQQGAELQGLTDYHDADAAEHNQQPQPESESLDDSDDSIEASDPGHLSDSESSSEYDDFVNLHNKRCRNPNEGDPNQIIISEPEHSESGAEEQTDHSSPNDSESEYDEDGPEQITDKAGPHEEQTSDSDSSSGHNFVTLRNKRLRNPNRDGFDAANEREPTQITLSESEHSASATEEQTDHSSPNDSESEYDEDGPEQITDKAGPHEEQTSESDSSSMHNNFVTLRNKRLRNPNRDGGGAANEEDPTQNTLSESEHSASVTEEQTQHSSADESNSESGSDGLFQNFDNASLHSEQTTDFEMDNMSDSVNIEHCGFENQNRDMGLWDGDQANESISSDANEEQENEAHIAENMPDNVVTGTDGFQKLLTKLHGVYSEDIPSQPTVNPNDIIQMVIGLSQRHRWTHHEKEDLMKLVNWIVGRRILPDTRFLIDSVFFPKSSLTYFFYCCKCTKMLGSSELIEMKVKTKTCPNTKCAHSNVISDLSKATYFVCFDVPSQIALLLQDQNVRRKLLNPKSLFENSNHDRVMRDLYDGSVYRKFLSYLDFSSNTHYVSVSMSVDGVALFVTSTVSITPCFLMINELPPVLRMNNLILAGLWFGKKVQTDVFLPPIVDKIKHLSNEGFNIKVEDNVYWHVKLYLLSLVADSGLRWDVQGIHAHRGEYIVVRGVLSRVKSWEVLENSASVTLFHLQELFNRCWRMQLRH